MYSWKFWNWKSIRFCCKRPSSVNICGQQGTVTLWHPKFSGVACTEILARKSFIVRCHCPQSNNGSAHSWETISCYKTKHAVFVIFLSPLTKTDNFGNSTLCPCSKGVRLIGSQQKGKTKAETNSRCSL